ncbi:MAG: hypothetical protein JNL98_01360 [Bryobacterales bacterium]|nr:hypothetical protein [Bryobacterales bacterium]
MRRLLFLIPALAMCQVTPEITTNIQLENMVFYVDQHGDATKFGTLPGPVPADPQLGFPLRRYAIIADIVSVGGKPAAGTFFAQGTVIGLINADFARNQMHPMTLEIMTPDRAQVGALYGFWMGAGASAPGAPAGAGVLAVLGGTGPYFGVRGQGANVGSSNLRTASMQEDPTRRRVNGGGSMTMGIHLSGALLPNVISAFHSDFTPVTTDRPARAGEVLTLKVRAGWPVQPSLAAGQVFPQDPVRPVSTPIEALVNDAPAEVINAIGWPGSRDEYRVDIRVPSGATPGTAKVQVNGAYLPGAVFNLPVR